MSSNIINQLKQFASTVQREDGHSLIIGTISEIEFLQIERDRLLDIIHDHYYTEIEYSQAMRYAEDNNTGAVQIEEKWRKAWSALEKEAIGHHKPSLVL